MPSSSSFTVDLRCPDDGHMLQIESNTPVPFASCRHCDGLWFTREAMESGGRPQLPPPGKPRRSAEPSGTSRTCPQCAVRLDAVPVDDVLIDVCPSCGGIWLDPHEYRAARRRSVKQRIERDLPSLRENRSRIGRFMNRVIDAIGERWIEEDETEFDARGLVPRNPRRV